MSTSTKATVELLEADFGYPHTIVTDNATTFTSEEFREWCKSRGIVHLTGAPYHPATNGAAERLVQTFKQALRKSSLPPKEALQQFLMQYRRTPLSSGYSPSELLNGRQLRAAIDTLMTLPAHQAQQKQNEESLKMLRKSPRDHQFTVGMSCYALYFGPKRDKEPRWVPAVVTKVYGSRSVNVKVYPRGPTWRRHVDQWRPRYTSEEDNDPGEVSAQPGVTLPSAEESPPTPDPPVESQDGSTGNFGESTVPTGATRPPSPPSDCSHTVLRRSSRIKEKRPVHYYTGTPTWPVR